MNNKMNNKIHKIVDKEFELFIKDNHEIFLDIPYDQTYKIEKGITVNGHLIHHKQLLDFPFYITYLGKMEQGEGDYYFIFDRMMDKIYTHYDIE